MKPVQSNRIISVFGATLLFALSTPVVMHYRIFPVEGTSYPVFLAFFLLNLINIFYSLYTKSNELVFNKVTNFLTWGVIVIALVGAMWTSIADRGKIAPGQNFQTHDIILQLESAIRYVTRGKNPYKETYFGTPMESWHYSEDGKDAVNPALYHFVMPPGYLLSAYPFYFVSMRTLGYFDGRMPLLAALVGLLFILFVWMKDKSIARLAIILTAFNPATVDYLIEGRSDFQVLFWFILTLFLLDKKHIFWSAITFAFALMTKQTVWFAFPVLFGYIWVNYQKNRVKQIITFSLISGFVSFGFMLPFLLWDWRAFIDSVVFYLSGNSVHSYPISGYGLGMLLMGWGVIRNIHDTYPFAVWQALLGIPAIAAGIWWITKSKNMSTVIIVHAATLFVVWYISRYFNNSHVGYLATLFSLGVLKYWDEAPQAL